MYREAVENESSKDNSIQSLCSLVTCIVCPYTVNLQLLIECQLLQTEVLHKNNMELAQTNDAIAQAYANKGKL